MRNLHLTFDFSTYSQKLGEDFAKFCGLLRIYELYVKSVATFAPIFYGYVYHFRLSKCGQDNIFFVSYKPKQVLARIFRVSRREELVCYVTIFC